MKRHSLKTLLLSFAVIFFASCAENPELSTGQDDSLEESSPLKAGKNMGFVHGIVINIDGEDYYFAGAPDGPGGAFDIPGHYWVLAGKDKVVGKHYNTGPFGAPNWWSSDAEDGELLYIVHGFIDTWSLEKAEAYYEKGYVHYHEFVKVADPKMLHPSKVVWFKHTAVTSFTLDGGPGQPNPPYEHAVSPGIDFEFPNNSFNPYPEV